jgi:hypothetical protein
LPVTLQARRSMIWTKNKNHIFTIGTAIQYDNNGVNPKFHDEKIGLLDINTN